MLSLHRTIATLGATALVATPLTVIVAGPATAADREFRVAGAEVDFDVDKDDGRFEVEVNIDDATPRSKWRVVLRHDGKRFHKRVHRADRDGDIEIDRTRRDTRGRDVFKVKVKKIGGPKAKTRTIRLR